MKIETVNRILIGVILTLIVGAGINYFFFPPPDQTAIFSSSPNRDLPPTSTPAPTFPSQLPSYSPPPSVPSYIPSNPNPIGASARCSDGSTSYSQHRRGTCSHHGGVAVWY